MAVIAGYGSTGLPLSVSQASYLTSLGISYTPAVMVSTPVASAVGGGTIYVQSLPQTIQPEAPTYAQMFPIAPVAPDPITPIEPDKSNTSLGVGWDAMATIGKVFGDIGSVVGGTIGGALGAGITTSTGVVTAASGILGSPAPPLVSAPYQNIVQELPKQIQGATTTIVHDVITKIVEVPVEIVKKVADATSKGLFGVDITTLAILGVGAIVLMRE
jgi:hypothetical protein